MKNKSLIILIILILLIASLFAFSSCKNEKVEGIQLNIMSFNIRQNTITDGGVRSWNFRKNYLPDYVNSISADIICMQEVKKAQYNDLISSSLNDSYEIIWYDRGDGEGNAVLYNDKFDFLEKEVFWLSETPQIQSKGFGANYFRICVHVTLKIKQTQEIIEVFDVHLDHISAKARRCGISLVVDRMLETNNRSIVAGDFNTTSKDECYNTISTNMKDSKFAKITEDGYTFNNFGGVKTFDKEIDYIFVDDSCYLLSYSILKDMIQVQENQEAYYSDHFAILSKVIFTE